MNEKNIRNAVTDNPLLVLLLGACPAMGASVTVQGALGMGVAVLAVMLFSGIVIAALRKVIPAAGRLPVCVLIIAGFTSIVQMLMNAFLPDVYQMLGIYLTVVAVNLLVFGTGEAAGKGVGSALAAAVKTGLLFLAVLLAVGFVREVFGSASVWGVELTALKDYRIKVLAEAPGGFLVYSFAAALLCKLCPACTKNRCGNECEEVAK